RYPPPVLLGGSVSSDLGRQAFSESALTSSLIQCVKERKSSPIKNEKKSQYSERILRASTA
ncbi:MAG: hypothetical protein ACON5J_04635, partial [Rubripirellula sp.]